MTRPEPLDSVGVHGRDSSSWTGFLDTFHDQRPGITEQILARSFADQLTPYQWLTGAVAETGTVLDVACGNGPLANLFGARWIGTDRSRSELACAIRNHAQPVVVGDATNLPFPTAATDTVVCSMSLQITEPLPVVLAEIVRVLRPGGGLVAIIPARRPLTLRDRWRYLALIRTLGDPFSTPNDRVLGHPRAVVEAAGLTLLSDDARRFRYRIDSRAAAETFVSSLYLRDVSPARVDAANKLVRRWVGTTLGVPIRRLVCIAATGGAPT